MAQQHRNRDTFRPWWRLALRFVLLTLFFALAYTYLPDLSSGRPFLVELRSAAILAAATIAVTAVVSPFWTGASSGERPVKTVNFT